MKKGKLIIGIVLLIIGAFYALMPHSVHISSGLDFGLSHVIHILFGTVLIVVGIVLLWITKKR